jgi:hypothetical protein
MLMINCITRQDTTFYDDKPSYIVVFSRFRSQTQESPAGECHRGVESKDSQNRDTLPPTSPAIRQTQDKQQTHKRINGIQLAAQIYGSQSKAVDGGAGAVEGEAGMGEGGGGQTVREAEPAHGALGGLEKAWRRRG